MTTSATNVGGLNEAAGELKASFVERSAFRNEARGVSDYGTFPRSDCQPMVIPDCLQWLAHIANVRQVVYRLVQTTGSAGLKRVSPESRCGRVKAAAVGAVVRGS